MGNTGSALQGLLWSDSVQLYLLLLPYPKPLCYGHAGPFTANLHLFVIFPCSWNTLLLCLGQNPTLQKTMSLVSLLLSAHLSHT